MRDRLFMSLEPLKPLLKPLSRTAPAGGSIKHHPLCDEIRELRRHEADLPQGVWEEGRQASLDTERIIQHCIDILKNKSKDLQVALWLTQAWFQKYQLKGAVHGFELIYGLLKNFWTSLHPQLELTEEAFEEPERFQLIEWFDRTFSESLLLLHIAQSQNIDDKNPILSDYLTVTRFHTHNASKNALSSDANSDTRSLSFMQKTIHLTPRSFYEAMHTDLTMLRKGMEKIETLLQKKSSQTLIKPFFAIEKTLGRLEEIWPKLTPEIPNETRLIQTLKKKALDVLQPKTAATTNLAEERHPSTVAGLESNASPLKIYAHTPNFKETHSLEQADKAYALLEEVAHFLKYQSPQNPAAELILKACAWRSKSFLDIIEEFETPQDAAAFFRHLSCSEKSKK